MTPALIVAEAGVNHDGDPATALELVDAAADAGADAVKFQTYRTELLVREDAPQAAYQRERAPAASQAAMLRALELDAAAHAAVAARSTALGIEFFSTPFDPPSLELLLELGVGRIKVASGELTNWPMLLRMARTGLPMLVSTGMATLEEVADALAVLTWGRRHAQGAPSRRALAAAREAVAADGPAALPDVTILHCTSSYPARPEDVNLRAMDTIAAAFGLPVGYSDHTEGLSVAVAAVARGATVLEKHLTLDRARPGPDHAASLDPSEFAQMVAAVRATESSLGDPQKRPGTGELGVREVARRSLVAARAVRAGKVLTEEDLVALRPDGGTHPGELWRLVGTRAPRDLAAGESLKPTA